MFSFLVKLALGFSLLATLCPAAPKMWVKDGDNRVPLRVDYIKLNVTVLGNVAETVYEMRFKNETDRMQEGEFVLQLPEGATVSQYALEVNGKMRDAVSVEKKQARHAYETIKARKIDPGIVERGAGNTYRTRVFPILANSTKSIRIGYSELLSSNGGQMHYELPIEFPGEVDEFECNVHHIGLDKKNVSIKCDALVFKSTGQQQWQASEFGEHMQDTLRIVLKPERQEKNASMITEEYDGRHYFLLEIDPPKELSQLARRKADVINLTWDASLSGKGLDRTKEFALLDAFFKQVKDTHVQLHFLRNIHEYYGDFLIQNGDWSELRKVLENTFYDGAAYFDKMHYKESAADFSILVTDGKGLENLEPQKKLPQMVIAQNVSESIIGKLSVGHGAVIDLGKDNQEEALNKLSYTAYKIKTAYLDNISVSIPEGADTTRKIYLTGSYRGNAPESLRILYANASQARVSQTLDVTHKPLFFSQGILRRIKAQLELLELEREGASRKRIIDHAKENSLVSNYTSLIVLERFRDYVEFDIPPPEPDLRAKWERVRNEKRKIRRDFFPNALNILWKRRMDRCKNHSSWLSDDLLARYQQTKIWVDASQQVFKKEDLDQEVFSTIHTWQKKANAYIKKQPDLKSDKDFEEWIKQEPEYIKEWEAFKNLKPKLKENQRLAVSIRGLVQSPDTYRFDKPLTLKESIKQAGGLHSYGSEANIQLYRNAHSLTYNVASKRFSDIALLPGDMIVAGSYWSSVAFGADPFGESHEEPDLSEGAPVSEQAPSLRASRNEDRLTNDIIADANQQSSESYMPKLVAGDARIEVVVLNKNELSKFSELLAKSQNKKNTYQEFVHDKHYATSTWLEITLVLLENGEKQLALQALSNLVEIDEVNHSSLRSYAYWLAEFGMYQEAASVFLNKIFPNDGFTLLDRARMLRMLPKQRELPELLLSSMYKQHATAMSAAHSLIGITEMCSFSEGKELPPKAIDAGIRCVVFYSNPFAKFEIKIRDPKDKELTNRNYNEQIGFLHNAFGVSEFIAPNPKPGDYQIMYFSDMPTTLQAVIYQNYGRPNQSEEWITIESTGEPEWKSIKSVKVTLNR